MKMFLSYILKVVVVMSCGGQMFCIFIGLKFLLGNNLQLSIKAAGHEKGIKNDIFHFITC